jgi:two-component system, chemotaxis family, sensor kinase CheA
MISSELYQEYLEESRQLLSKLEQSLVALEKNSSTEEINNVYRYMHTLKGSAGMFGFDHIERLAHELEFLYSDIRDGLRQVDEAVIDIALHAVDIFADLLNGMDSGNEVDKLIATIHHLTKNKAAQSVVSQSSKLDLAQTLQCYVIFLKPEKEIFARGVNLKAILEDVKETGDYELFVHNEAIPFETQLVNKSVSSWLEIIICTTAGFFTLADIFMFMKKSEYTILEVSGPEVFTSPEYHQHILLAGEELDKRIEVLNKFTPDEKKAEVNQDKSAATEVVSGEDDTDAFPQLLSQSKNKNRGHVNVATEKLDGLINIVSELVIFRSELTHLMGENQSQAITEAIEKLDRLTLNLRDSAFNIRLVPINIVNVKIQRLIRSVSKELGKEINFITEGLDTELDRSMINALEGPLMHLIRNSIDHGIESPEEREKSNKPKKGLLKLFSYNSGDHVFIQVQDDGRGLDFEKIKSKGIEKGLITKGHPCTEKELINLMMSPGFSTADKVTTVSGRGVGMDVVKREISAMRGDIEVSTEHGLGTIFTIRLPLTLTVLDTLVVRVKDNKYLIPINEVEHCFKETHQKLFEKKSRLIEYDGGLTPFVSLREYFSLEERNAVETVIVVNKNDTRIAVVVDEIVGKLQTVYKPLNTLLPIDCFSGSSILGDGSMALIINALKLRN